MTGFSIKILCFCCCILLLSCDGEREINHISAEVVQMYGKPDGNQNEIFGMISCFAINQNEELYIVDRSFKCIKIYSPEALLLREIALSRGNGPGEFIDIQDIDVDSAGNIGLADKISRRIIILDSTGAMSFSLKVPMMPAQIIMPQVLNVFISGFPFSYEGPLIHNYNFRSSVVPEKARNVFCERIKDPSKAAELTGNSGRLSKNSKGEILFSFFYPYEIRVYSPEGKLKVNYSRESVFYEEPYFDKNNMVVSPGGCRGLLVFEGHIANFINYSKNDSNNCFLDLWDISSHEYFGTASAAKFKIENVRYIKSDFHNNIYYDIFSPFPRIVKVTIGGIR